MFKEFKEFALKGNLIDMAVAFVMGAAFTKLSGSFIEDLVMPLVGKISGGIDFTNKFIALVRQGDGDESGRSKKTGSRARLRELHHDRHQFRHRRVCDVPGRQGDQQGEGACGERPPHRHAPPEPTAEEKLLGEIRDLLKQKG